MALDLGFGQRLTTVTFRGEFEVDVELLRRQRDYLDSLAAGIKALAHPSRERIELLEGLSEMCSQLLRQADGSELVVARSQIRRVA